jgi:hypothetical protein
MRLQRWKVIILAIWNFPALILAFNYPVLPPQDLLDLLIACCVLWLASVS